MKVIIACDHGGFKLKEQIISFLLNNDYSVEDIGTDSTESVDYPDYGKKVAEAVSKSTENLLGVLICSSGVGMSITANRVQGARAVLCNDEYTAQLSRLHNNANIIVFGAKIITPDRAKRCLTEFLNTPFTNEARHIKRIGMIDQC